MNRVTFVASGLMALIGGSLAASFVEPENAVSPVRVFAGRRLQDDRCSPRRRVVEIREANPDVDLSHHDAMRDIFIQKASQPNTTILLGPTVVLDFSKIDDLPVRIGRCVTIRSVARFDSVRDDRAPTSGTVLDRGRTESRSSSASRRADSIRAAVADIGRAEEIVDRMGERGVRPAIPEARSSTSFGPLLKFGKHRAAGDRIFLMVTCDTGMPVDSTSDHVRISGFRIFGPSFGHQEVGDKGILINKCVDVEISNMEVAGFGGEGIRVQDDANEYYTPPILAEAWQLRRLPGACAEPPYNGPRGRIGSPNQVRIVNNYIHNNQQPSHDGHAGGYGVEVTYGAYALISRNLFSTNRHSIAAGGTMGGYDALENLVLRYGGIHWDSPITVHTHAFDIHGTGDNGFDGFAGARTNYSYNAFQYDADQAISIRGSPRCGITISHNVFPHHGLENDWGADAVKLNYREDLDVIKLGPDNTLDYQSYGKYAVCDFDGDGIDDLFLPTGISWWFSGAGEFPWRFLSQHNDRLEQLRFGYFDADNKCDVVKESGGAWLISSGGAGAWYRLGQNYAPLRDVQFGRFDLSQVDRRPGATRRTTHAFWRTSTGQWKATTLTGPGQGWHNLNSSSLPMSALRFGDFNGDGVTDVLATVSGRWMFSSGGAASWDTLNVSLGDDVKSLFIADIDNNNIDDLIRIKYTPVPINSFNVRETIAWSISYNGRTPWRSLKTYNWTTAMPVFTHDRALHVFAGRFGSAPGGGVMTVDRAGTGRFYAPLETRAGANPDWNSTFSY